MREAFPRAPLQCVAAAQAIAANGKTLSHRSIKEQRDSNEGIVARSPLPFFKVVFFPRRVNLLG
jgi:hypothetical protein